MAELPRAHIVCRRAQPGHQEVPQGTKVDAQSSLIYKDQQHLHFIREPLPPLCMPSTPTRDSCPQEGKEGLELLMW